MEQQVGGKQDVSRQHQVVTKQQALRMLETYFGYTSFRPAQEAPIASLLRNEDVIGIMPTGAGKSICFQIPALCKAGLTIVFSPLISLMKDQVDGLLVQNIPAALINSTLTQSEFNKTMYEVRSGKIKLLYIAPERLSSNFFCNVLRALPIAQVIVDEAHCISEWGHDFRPSYRLIGEWLNSLPKRPIVGAFTATATKYVENDIKKLLGLDKANVYVTGFDRPNLSFSVIRTPKRMDYVVHYVRQHANENGIIYCATRKDVDRVYENLTRAGTEDSTMRCAVKCRMPTQTINCRLWWRRMPLVWVLIKAMYAMYYIIKCRVIWSPIIRRQDELAVMGHLLNVSCFIVGRMCRFISI